jgi:hypothetical protein
MLQKAASLNVEASLDCSLPLCFFEQSSLGWIAQYHPGTTSSLGTCGPALDVTPELDVLRCFSLADITRVKLTSFKCARDIEEWFRI